MPINFHINPETGQPHILDHGVTENEVEEVLATAPEERRGRNGTRIANGRTFAGRALRIVFVRSNNPYSIFVITAYVLRGNELAAFRRRMRRSNR